MKLHVRYPSRKQCFDDINDSYKFTLNRRKKKRHRSSFTKSGCFEHPIEVMYDKMRKRQDSFCKGNTCLTNLIDFSERLNKHIDKREIQSIHPVWLSENYSTRSLTNKSWSK